MRRPLLSRRIKAEEQLGRAIFERTARGLRETAFGGPFLTRLSIAFRQLSEAVATTRRRDDAILTISVAPIFASLDLVTLQGLNGRVQVGGEPAASVARDYLTRNGFIK